MCIRDSILDGAGLNRHFGAVFLEALGQAGAPQHRHIGLGGRAQIGQGVEETEGHLGDQMPSVGGEAADSLGLSLIHLSVGVYNVLLSNDNTLYRNRTEVLLG